METDTPQMDMDNNAGYQCEKCAAVLHKCVNEGTYMSDLAAWRSNQTSLATAGQQWPHSKRLQSE